MQLPDGTIQIINEEEKIVEIKKERVYINNLNQLQGLESLWGIAI